MKVEEVELAISDKYSGISPEIIKDDFALIWKNINYEIESKSLGGKKKLLENITGYCKSGELTAIMGPSGAGKSTLLDFLKNKISFPKNSTHSGNVYLNSMELSWHELQRYLTYVTQETICNEILTPREIFSTIAELRYNKSAEEVSELVEKTLKEMQLEKCSETAFGSEISKGLSGGEKKRVCIGQKLLIDAPVMFLDEPTGGLDSSTSFVIINLLKEYAKANNKVILTTIHQPSSNIFDLFDRLIVINNGRIVYHGKPTEISTYFESKGLPLNSNYNPADSFLRQLEILNRNPEKKEYLAEEFSKEEFTKVSSEIDKLQDNKNKFTSKDSVYSETGVAVSVLLKNIGRSMTRNPASARIRVFNVLVFSFIMGSIFYGLKDDDEGIRGKFGCLLFFTISNFMQNIMIIVVNFPVERYILIDDYTNNLYDVLPWFVSKQLVETPFQICLSILYCAITYFVVGFQWTAVNFFVFVGIYACFVFNVNSFGYLFGIFVTNPNKGFTIVNFLMIFLFVFSGAIINHANMPVWLAWLRFISPLYYALQAAFTNEFEGRTLKLQVNIYELIKEDLEIWHCIVYLLGVGFFLRILGYVGMSLVVRRKI